MSWVRDRRSVLAALACAGCAACSLAVAATPGRGHHRPAHRCRSHRRGAHSRRCRLSQRGRSLERKPGQSAAPTAPSAATQPAGAPALAPAQPGSQRSSASGGPVTEPSPAPSRAQVTALEYKLTLSRTQVSAGGMTIELVDGGQDEHNLHIRPVAAGADVAAFPTIRPGQHVDERIELAPGTYTFYCSLPGHEALGMKATFTVSAQPGATASASRTRSGSS